MSARGRAVGRGAAGLALAAVLPAVLLAAGPAAAAAPAAAAPVARTALPPAPAVDDDDLLMLTSEEVGLTSLSPGATLRWQVGAHLAGAPWGDLAVELYADGDLVLAEPGLLVRVDSCDVRWTADGDGAPDCAGTARLLFAEHRVVAGTGTSLVDVGTLTPADSRWLLVQVTLPASTPDSSQRLGARLGVGLTAVGDERLPPATPGPTAGPTARPTAGGPAAAPVTAGRPGAAAPGPGTGAGSRTPAPAVRAAAGVLARTGSDPLAALALGAGTVLAGLALAAVARGLR